MTNAELNVLVRVRAAEAQRQIAQMQTQLNIMQRQVQSTQASSNQPWFSSMSAAGSRMQWVGRQITANLSGPIIAGTALLVKSAMDQETAMARLKKLYGDASMSQEQMTNETNALARAFTALSAKFGVAREDVINIAADWAAAGSSGVALAKSTELTMRTMVIGEMNAAEATEALIAIQAQYGQNTEGLTDTIYQLNAAENVSGTTLKGLVTGFAKAAGVARSAGVDTQHLAAMVAALTPAAGSASEAGNALKTIISRLMSPTKEAADVLNEMGINLDDSSWKSLNATQRMELLAKKFEGLSEAQKPVVSALVASRWQINKFEVAMRELNSTQGYYQKVLDATMDKNNVYAVAQKELNTVLSTSTNRTKQAGQVIKNSLTDVVIPLLPAIAGLAQWVAKMTMAFTNLSPSVQKMITIGVALLAVLGPTIVMLGTMKLMIGQLAPLFMFLGRVMLLPLAPLKLLGAALLLPFTGTARLMGVLLASRAAFGGASIAAMAYRTAILAVAFASTAMQGIIIGGAAAIATAQRVFAAGMAAYPAIMASARAAMTAIWVGLGQTLLILDTLRASSGIMIERAAAAAHIAIAEAWQATVKAMTIAWNYAMLAATAGYWAIYHSIQQTYWRLSATLAAGWQMVMLVAERGWQAARVGVTVAGNAAAAAATRAGYMAMAAIQAAWSALTLANLKRWALGFVAITSGAMTGALNVMKVVGVAVARFLVSPWALAIGAVVAILATFKNQIANAIGNVIEYFRNMPQGIKNSLQPLFNVFSAVGNTISRAFNALPESVQTVLIKLVSIVRAAALKIYDLFSYINPFAHHSPSLVENVTAGMAKVGEQFGLAERKIGQSTGAMYDSIKRMGEAARNLTDSNDQAAHADVMEKLAKTAPDAAAAYDEVSAHVKKLKGDLEAINGAIENQQKVVDGLSDAVKAADKAIDGMNKTLDAMKSAADAIGDMLDKAKERVDYFANAQIEGMGAADDAIFANQMAQKQLQLQIAKYKQSAGDVENLTDQYSKLQGQMETLNGQKLDLQMKGAGSDITAPYDAMIADIQKQQQAISDGASGPAAELDALEKQLSDLQAQADIMDLEKSLKFDGLNRQLEKMKDNIHELPFDQIVSGYNSSKSAVDGLTAAQEAANMSIKMQEQAIKAAQTARDALSAQYDTENDKLQTLKDSYDNVDKAIKDGEQSLNDLTTAADTALQRMEDARQTMLSAIRLGLDPNASKAAVEAAQQAQDIEDAYKSLEEKKKRGDYVSPGLQNFRDAAGGEFSDPGANFTVGREGGLGDQSAQIDEFTNQTMKELSNMWGGLDPFKPLKDMWNKAWDWMKTTFGPLAAPLKTMFSDLWKGIGEGFGAPEGELTRFQQVIENIKGAFENTWNFLKMIGGILKDLFGPDLQNTITGIADGFKDMWATIGPKLADLMKNLQPLWDLLKLIGAELIPVLLLIGETVWEMFNGAIKPVFAFIGDIIGAVIDIIKGLIRIIGGIAQVFIGVFTLDPSKILEGLKNIVGGVGNIIGAIWDSIVSLFKNGIQLVVGLVWGFVKGIIDFFTHLWDVLVGHSIVPDMIVAIIGWFYKLPIELLKLVWDLVTKIVGFFWDLAKQIPGALLNLGQMLWDAMKAAWQWIVDNGPDILANVLVWVGNIELWILDKLVGLGKGLWDWMKGAWQWIVDNGPDILANFLVWVGNIELWILDKLVGLGKALWDWMKGAWQWIVDNGPDILVNFLEWVGKIEFWILDKLADMGKGLWDWMKGAFQWIVDNGPDILSGLLGWVGGIAKAVLDKLGDTGKWLYDAGKNMIQGLLNGAGSLLEKIGEFFLDKVPGWIKEPFKKALGIHSPSTVFAEYGDNTAQGYIDGMAARSGDVQAASQAMADAAGNISTPDLSGVTAGDALADPTGGKAIRTVADSVAATTADATDSWTTFAAQMDTQVNLFATSQGTLFTQLSATVSATWTTMFSDMSTVTTDTTGQITATLVQFQNGTTVLFTNISTSTLQTIKTMTDQVVTLMTGMKDQLAVVMTTTKEDTATNFQDMADALQGTFDNSIKPVFDAFTPMLDKMEKDFTDTVGNVGTIWDGMKEKTAAPARFVINDVYNGGIRVAWSKVSGWLGLKELDQFVAPFAEGGPLVPTSSLRNPNSPINIKGGGALRAGRTDDTLFAGKGGEFVMNERMVEQAGGTAALERWRRAALAGRSVEGALSGVVMGFEAGGTIPGKVIDAKKWAQQTFTGQVYDYGGAGPNGFDCSGAQSAMWNFLTDQPNLWRHTFDTEVDFSRFGFVPGLSGAYTIGVHNGGGGPYSHMAGTLDGTNLESGGAHNSSIFGGPAAGSDHPQFEKHYTLAEIGGKFSSGGMGGAYESIRQQVEKIFKETMDPIGAKAPAGLMDMGKVGYQKYYDEVSKFLYSKADEIDAQRASQYSGSHGGGVEQWRGTVQDVLRTQGRPLGLDEITLSQMETESNGDPRAINLWDSNAKAGTPSKGLMQVTDPTFSDFHDSRYPYDIWDPHANIAAALNQVFGRYGGPQGVWGQGHGYDNGGYLQPGMIGNFTGADEPVLTHNQWGAMFAIAKSAEKFSDKTVSKGVVSAYQQMYGIDPSTVQAADTATAVTQENSKWIPQFADAADATATAATTVANSTNKTTTALDRFTKVGGDIKTSVDNFSKLMLAISAAMTNENPNSFAAWAPVIGAAADFIESLPDAKATYVPWAGTKQTVTDEMRAQKAANDLSNLAKGGYMFFKQVMPSILRSVATIGTAVETLIAQDAAAWAQGIGLLATGNPMGALILIPIILKEIFTILPLILNAILDIVPAIIKAIIMLITQFMPDSVYSYDSYDEANTAATQNEAAIKNGASAPYFVEPQSSGSNQTVNVYVYQVDVNADSPDSADEFVTNLQTLR